MGTTTDRLLSRRESWNGVVVQDLSVPQGDPAYGQYYRVRHSQRDPNTGTWEIRWNPVLDHVEPMAARWEKVYLFDGTTWDLPLRAAHAVPWMTIAVAVPLALIIWPVCYAAFGNYEFAAYVFLGCITVTLWNWFYNVEPVRGTKVGAALMAAHVANQAHYKAEAERTHAEREAHWRQGWEDAGLLRPGSNQVLQPERQLPSGLILPAEHVQDGWKR